MNLETLRMYLTPLAEGTMWTLALFFCSAVLAVALGLLVCLCRLSKSRVLSRGARLYIDIIRGTPLLLQLFYIYYGMPELGVVINAFVAGVLGLTLNFGAYLAELFRSGIQSVDSGQYEAARALGLNKVDRLRRVVLPQAVRTVFPALGNYALVLIKETSLVAVISVYELMRAGEMLAGATFQALTVYTMVGAIYFAMCSVLAYLFRRSEKRLTVPGYWSGAGENHDISKA
ncbi:amino acid ABC transporter permease [Bordetella bronchiseptica]|uniref:amino acid ABC transporter permease n=1 Tax=Bordetella bronchiseptica TaxID=518 RepID=UPI00081D3010|nr:amino acid ABC transporter permease [Bordetella bronchiseptica]AOB25979.1 amino acid ABC transporter permease [Bordetella bronchiseptica]AZW43257.1 amino acid ABC transporter permease [Bordetella bronchiseptica]